MGSKYKRILDKKITRYGQSATLHVTDLGTRCPCFDESTGYGDLHWHIQNPDNPDCNEEGYIDSDNVETSLKAFILPASDISAKGLEEIILANIGKVRQDEYVYIGKSDVNIFNLKETDYLTYNNRKWKIKNPDVYKVGDISIVYVARLELLGDDPIV